MAKQRLKITLSENDIEELRSGEVFDWCMTTDEGEDIDISVGLSACCDDCCEELLPDDQIETEDERILCFGCDSKRLEELNKEKNEN